MGLFDKLKTGSSQKPAPPPYSATNNNNNNHQNSSKLNPYPPTVTSPVTPISPSMNQAGSSDQRALPPGWVKEWHDGYQRFYYVDTLAPGGPVSHWTHPSDHQQGQDRTGYGQTHYTSPQPQAGFGQPQQPVYQPQQPVYQPQQPVYQQQRPVPQMMGNNNGRGRAGMNPLMAGAGGLAGGMLLGSMLGGIGGHHGYDNGYEQGYENGYDNGYDNGDMFGGGDFGGGDFGGGDFF
ncbi:uncharacterized protein MELLADRAFT_74828 [Melampsora larici-populina 98AG31]|uniref:Uncharacterized protein n=1 Tax=Melampsora larici-populina (strain 98AG31 / pathotype 3-4-7) TaxID=747676 RepID=F4RM70_MELLP|nr:uncharacterized protein MELLADRAFT_74828 [Melampsora larici-populina 98AG31]EGG06519.1 hypothetical protein MELLADRAFT_74828 [Melampsora larici-populina 98AG31]